MGLFGAYFTGFLNPRWCFGLIGAFGVVVLIAAFGLNSELEKESDLSLTNRPRTFTQEVRHNWRVVKNQFKLRLFWRTLLFFALIGVTRVNSQQFLYFWKLEVAGLSQF